MPRAVVAGRSGVMYAASSRARSASIALRSISGIRASGVSCGQWQAYRSRRHRRPSRRPGDGPRALSEDAQFDADVAARRPGVRADLVRAVGELAHLLAFHPRNVDNERDDQIERVTLGTDADLRGHRGVAERGLLVTSHRS